MNDINQEPDNKPNDTPGIINQPSIPPRPKLYKSFKSVVLTGVCGGLAEYFNISSILVRLIFIILTFLGGWGIIFYVILSLMIPEHPSSNKKLFEKVDTKKLLGFALLVTGAYFFLGLDFIGIFNLLSFTGSIIFPVILTITGLWILIKGKSKFIYTPVTKREKLFRSQKQRIILGVCGGLAEYMYMDVNIIRLLWLILSLVTLGIGIIIYFLFSLFIPPYKNMVPNEE